jgi:hypothetical protein
MNDQEALPFIRSYFDELFGKRNPDALDAFLDPEYSDDDIADPGVDQIKNGKEYLRELFKAKPTIGVEVVAAQIRDDVISAYLDWYVVEDDQKRILKKGVAIFVVRDRKILKRHTFLYYED